MKAHIRRVIRCQCTPHCTIDQNNEGTHKKGYKMPKGVIRIHKSKKDKQWQEEKDKKQSIKQYTDQVTVR
jgi:hypothetical protein